VDKKALALLLACLIALLGSFIFGFLTPVETFLGNYPITILIIIFFFFGVIGFGFISFIPHLLLGFALGTKKNAILFLYLAPIVLATYAGLKLGSVLLDDFNKKKYFLEEGKSILIFLGIALIIAITIEFTLPIIIETQLWPDETLGMSIERPESLTESLEDLKRQILNR
jgi:hypothetical protein